MIIKYVYLCMWNTNTVVIGGVVIWITFGGKIEHVIKEYVENEGAEDRSFWNSLSEFSPLASRIS